MIAVLWGRLSRPGETKRKNTKGGGSKIVSLSDGTIMKAKVIEGKGGIKRGGKEPLG